MRCCAIVALVAALSLPTSPAGHLSAVEQPTQDSPYGWAAQLKEIINRYLGYPYGFGCSGPKRFDCSGFVWRVIAEGGVYLKRTSSRKLFLALPKADDNESRQLGAVVFFNGLRHCGLVRDSSFFYHASRKRGTTCSAFDPYWRSKIYGYRKMPQRRIEKANVL
ncbi:MAG: C40 family peptidase [Syntrophobacteraceae bacterium]